MMDISNIADKGVSVGQASRISGVRTSDVALLMVLLEKDRRKPGNGSNPDTGKEEKLNEDSDES